jgi:hypothetical protein
MERVFQSLQEPFAADVVHWRVGSVTKDKSKGMALAYIDARDVMERLDAVCGPDGWQCEYTPMPNGTTCCRIGIRVSGEWVWKSNGAGATDFEGEKGGYSDAFKRAAVLWGIGRYLYDMPAPWVKIDQFKQIEKSELPSLRALLERNGQQTDPSLWDGLMSELKNAIPHGRSAVDAVAKAQVERVKRLDARHLSQYPDALQRALNKAPAVSYTHLTLPTTPYV